MLAMRVESNIAGVIGRVERLRRHDIPAALKQALDPAKWLELAWREAERTLWALAKPEQWTHVPRFLETLKALPVADGFRLRMRTPFLASATLTDLQAARAAVSPRDLNENLFLGRVQQFEEWITEWVEKEKRRDARDANKSNEEISQFISYLMLTPQPTPAELEARRKLMPHIMDWIQRRQGRDKLDAATVDAWLRAVLAAWRRMVQAHFGEMFRKEFRAVRTELAM